MPCTSLCLDTDHNMHISCHHQANANCLCTEMQGPRGECKANASKSVCILSHLSVLTSFLFLGLGVLSLRKKILQSQSQHLYRQSLTGVAVAKFSNHIHIDRWYKTRFYGNLAEYKCVSHSHEFHCAIFWLIDHFASLPWLVMRRGLGVMQAVHTAHHTCSDAVPG